MYIRPGGQNLKGHLSNHTILRYLDIAMRSSRQIIGKNHIGKWVDSSTRVLILATVVFVSGCAYFGKDKEDKFKDATAEEIYESVKENLVEKDWDEAIEELRILEARYPYGVYAKQAQIDTIYAHFRKDEHGLAIAAADRFISLNPTHESVDYAYYLKGLASFNENRSLIGRFMGKSDLSDRDPAPIGNALRAFTDVYTLFPDSRYAPDAKRRANYLLEALARNEIHIANYYYSRQAYIAVVKRATGVIENHPTTPSVEPALALLMFSYQQMGFEELAHDSRRVLELNYPDSEYLAMELSDARFSNAITPDPDDDNLSWFSTLFDRFRKDDPAS